MYHNPIQRRFACVELQVNPPIAMTTDSGFRVVVQEGSTCNRKADESIGDGTTSSTMQCHADTMVAVQGEHTEDNLTVGSWIRTICALSTTYNHELQPSMWCTKDVTSIEEGDVVFHGIHVGLTENNCYTRVDVDVTAPRPPWGNSAAPTRIGTWQLHRKHFQQSPKGGNRANGVGVHGGHINGKDDPLEGNNATQREREACATGLVDAIFADAQASMDAVLESPLGQIAASQVTDAEAALVGIKALLSQIMSQSTPGKATKGGKLLVSTRDVTKIFARLSQKFFSALPVTVPSAHDGTVLGPIDIIDTWQKLVDCQRVCNTLRDLLPTTEAAAALMDVSAWGSLY